MVKTICKVWKSGSSGWVITVPSNIRKILEVKEGDMIEIDFQKVAFNSSSQDESYEQTKKYEIK